MMKNYLRFSKEHLNKNKTLDLNNLFKLQILMVLYFFNCFMKEIFINMALIVIRKLSIKFA
jgi:hypothetical protein